MADPISIVTGVLGLLPLCQSKARSNFARMSEALMRHPRWLSHDQGCGEGEGKDDGAANEDRNTP